MANFGEVAVQGVVQVAVKIAVHQGVVQDVVQGAVAKWDKGAVQGVRKKNLFHLESLPAFFFTSHFMS